MDKKVLEVVLKKSVRDSNIEQIIDVESESALQKGENYTSLVLRLKLTVVLGNGRIAKKNLIMKKGHTGEGAEQIEKDSNFFGREAMMYLVMFKEMGYLMDEFGDYEEPLWCNCVHYDRMSRAIVLEDLKDNGFRLVKRQMGLDLEHSLLVLRSLGRFHALTKTLEERGVFAKESFKPYFFLSNPGYIISLFYAGLKSFGTAIKKYWGPEWANVADKMIMPQEKFIEKILSSIKLSEGDFTCLNHGDCWSNNIMFKYDWQDRPISLRFLDYQLPHCHSPCMDVSYFMHLSVRPEIRRQKYDVLLDCYYRSLSGSLKKYGYTGAIPTLKEIEDVMERFSFFGYSMITFLYPALTCESKDAFDLEKLLRTRGEEGFNEEIYKEPALVKGVGADLKIFAQKHL